jgi:hypothetical protein
VAGRSGSQPSVPIRLRDLGSLLIEVGDTQTTAGGVKPARILSTLLCSRRCGRR